MKSKFEKQVPKVLIYRNYKSFKNETFRSDLFYELCNEELHNIECNEFEDIFMRIFNRHAPIKR